MEEIILRAGMLPYMEHESERYYMVCRLVDHHNGKWMIAKGRRQIVDDKEKTGWRDVIPEDYPLAANTLEPLEKTARREGNEELGFQIPDNIKLVETGLCQHEIYDRDRDEYLKIPFMLFTALLDDDPKNTYVGDISDKESQGFWVTLDSFREHGRLDHVVMLQALDKLL